MIVNIKNSFFLKFILFFLFSALEFSHPQEIKFRSLTVEDGLSNNKVNTVIQDKTGFIWFGTDDGLNRYDGYNFKVFRNDPSDSNSLSDNSIWALCEDHSGYIWIGTKEGNLNQFDPKKEIFIRWKLGNERRDNSIANIYEDSKNNIWIATRLKGIYKLNPKTNELFNWKRDTSNYPLGLSHHSVRAIAEDNYGNILIGTYSGFNIFDPEKPANGFEKFFYESSNNHGLSSNQVYNISPSVYNSNIFWIGIPGGLIKYNSKNKSFERIKIPNPKKLQFGSGASTVVESTFNGEKILWVDTYDGLLRMDMNSGDWYRFVHKEKDPFSLISNRINKMIKDQSGVIWLATENGASYFQPKQLKFNSAFNREYQHYLNTVKNNKNLKAITQNKNNIWLGFEDGIVKLNYKNQSKTTQDHYRIKNFNTWSLTADDNNNLWIGTFGQGTKQFDLSTGKIKNWRLRFTKRGTTTVLFVKSLLKDSRNNIWVGYWGSGVGRINPSTGKYNLWISEPDKPESISNSDVWTIKEDKFGRIWLGTQGGGLNLFEDKNGGIFHHWTKQHLLSSNYIYSICESKKSLTSDSETILWIGTSNGLNKFVIKNKNESDLYDIKVTNEAYSRNNGLADNSVKSILEDENGNLWLGTNSGISFFNVKEKTFTNFSTEDGINGSVMNSESTLKLKSGLMLFGSISGLTVFNPKNIKLSTYQPNIVITDFKIFNKSVKIEKNSPLKKNIVYADKIILSYDQNVFSFEFAALDYNSSKSIRYQYIMEGFNKDWINSGTKRSITYTNLSPGKYIFKVRATNADKVWNSKIRLLSVVITPPWWQTWWAYFAYFILIALGFLLIRRFELNRVQLRNELKLREFEVKKQSELEELKSRFFANLSHEFKTPLMLIKGPLEQLKNGEDNHTENIEIIERNSAKLKELIDQLLELSHLEKAAIPLKTKQVDIIEILKGLKSSFEFLAIKKNISLTFSAIHSLKAWVDRDKFEKIINNLLSNAFKFTPKGGSVKIKVNEFLGDNKKSAVIEISDTGVGIPNDKLKNIFDRFYQVDDSSQRSYGGSGIGLALVKELIDLHGWKISVNSKLNEGTQFIVEIPLTSIDTSENKSAKNNFDDISDKDFDSRKNIQPEIPYVEQNYLDAAVEKPILLIVDDSEDVIKYLSGMLKEKYEIFTALNGEEGITKAVKIMPDLIISDVMMPLIDGMKFCSIIKSDWKTSDIPIILLTAKDSFESKIEGLEIGADDYLVKPFESRELFTRIKNLLEQRKRLRKKYSNGFQDLISKGKFDNECNDFIKKIVNIIEKNLDNKNFTTEKLASELFMSRTQLHRKTNEITGHSPGEFIRTFKLKYAAKLLIEEKLQITQIAYEVGFSSPAQFTRAFAKQFNCLPSEYLSKK